MSEPLSPEEALLRDAIDHIEGLNLVMAALRVGSRTPEKGLRLLDRTNDLPTRLERALDAARAAAPEPTGALDVAYRERGAVVAALIKVSGWRAWVAPAPDVDGWVIAYAETPQGQVSWHYGPDDFDLIAFLVPGTTPWDGHTTEEKYARLAALSQPTPSEGLRADVAGICADLVNAGHTEATIAWVSAALAASEPAAPRPVAPDRTGDPVATDEWGASRRLG